MRSSRTALTTLAVTAGLLACAAAAQADSIVYIDGGNVWSAAPDGSRKVQLTDGGDWHSPTQSDDGTIAAVEGIGPIQLLARDGRPLHTITTEEARSGDGGTFAPRPVELSLSPDGSRLAYSYVAGSCPPASTCGTVQTSTFYTYTNGSAASPQSLFGQQFSVSNPEWIGNDRVLLTGGYGSALDVDDLAGGGDSSFTRWVKYPVKDVSDAEVSRDGGKIAYIWDYGSNKVINFDVVTGDAFHDNPPPVPTGACSLNSPDAAFADPTWSPDSMGVAFHDSDGIDVLHFKAISANHCESTGPATTLTATGSEPDWGPADPPAARYAAAPAPAPAPAPARTATPTATARPAASTTARTAPAGGDHAAGSSLTLAGTTLKLANLRRGAAAVRVTAGRAGVIRIRVSSGRTTIATGRATVRRAGVVTVRLSRASRRALAALRGRHAALLSATLTTPGSERLEQSRPVRVK